MMLAMNRRRFLTLAAPSIIGISGIIQLSRSLIMPQPLRWYHVQATWSDGFQGLTGPFESEAAAVVRMRLPDWFDGKITISEIPNSARAAA